MRRLERYADQAMVDAVVDVFLADWSHKFPDVDVDVIRAEIDETGMFVEVDMIVDVYERHVKAMLYSDTHTAIDRIYEALWTEASK